MNLPVSATFVASYALLMIALAYNVSRLRVRKRVSIGDGDDHELSRARRAHGNAVENAVVMIPLVLVYELGGGHPLTLGILAGTFLLCRVLHAWGLLSRATSRRRFIGALGSYLTAAALAFLLLLQVIAP